MTTAGWVLLVLACGGISAAAVEVVRRAALHRSVLDVPNERSSHSIPTPRGGGVGMVLAVAVSGSVAALFVPFGTIVPVAVGALLVAAISAIDDVRTLGSGPRLLVHLVAAAIVVGATGGWESLALLGWTTWAVPALVAVLGGVAWVVGLTNAYNFMDGIDGIAAGQAIAAGATLSIAGAVCDVPAAAGTGALLAAAAAGFLLHNRPPARIFMGDVGSATLGFTFAALPLVIASDARATDASRMPLVALLAVWPFVLDAGLTFARRAAHGERLFDAHRSHLYQRYLIAGASPGRISLLYFALASGCGASAIVWVDQGIWGPAVAALGAVPAVLIITVHRAERRAAQGDRVG